MAQDTLAPAAWRFPHPNGPAERRRFHRFTRHGLVALIGERPVEIHDISLGGLCLAGRVADPGGMVEFGLAPREQGCPDRAHAVQARAEVMGLGADWTRLRFASMTYALAGFIINHLAKWNGISPYIFK